jgi:predicted membrane chloride channel (bestrophin family)
LQRTHRPAPGAGVLTNAPGLHCNAGTALFLLLAFRTNSCYDRWWEGRKLLDGINSKGLDLSRMALAFVAPLDPQLAQQMLNSIIVTAHAIKWNLRREKVRDCSRDWHYLYVLESDRKLDPPHE